MWNRCNNRGLFLATFALGIASLFSSESFAQAPSGRLPYPSSDAQGIKIASTNFSERVLGPVNEGQNFAARVFPAINEVAKARTERQRLTDLVARGGSSQSATTAATKVFIGNTADLAERCQQQNKSILAVDRAGAQMQFGDSPRITYPNRPIVNKNGAPPSSASQTPAARIGK